MVFCESETVSTPLGTTQPLDLRRVLPAEAIQRDYRAAVTARDAEAVARSILQLLEHFGLTTTDARTQDVLLSFVLLSAAIGRAMSDLPPAVLGIGHVSTDQPTDPPYEYAVRSNYVWVDLIAWAYHWDRETILSLHPREAARYVQEIKLREIENKEWQYGLTEFAYDKNGRYKPFRKPLWMTQVLPKEGAKPEEPKTIKIPKRFLENSGPVIRIDELVAKD